MKADNPPLLKTTFVQRIARLSYSLLLLVVVLPVALLRLMISRCRNDGNYRRLRQRLGLAVTARHSGGYLFHCVSVGEVVAASVVIKALQKQSETPSITISTTTATGAQRVNALFGDSVRHCYMPYDFPWVIAHWLKTLNPQAVVITEVELWPNLIHACWQQRRPVIVINARMTDKSARSYRRISALFRPMLNKLSRVCAQGERDYQNYLALGMDKHKLTLTNNIKFDQVAALDNAGAAPFLHLDGKERPVLVGGSTHEGEETALLDTLEQLSDSHPKLLLILVPRHPERFKVVKRLIEQRNLPFIQSSQASHVPDDCNVVLLDEMGKLNQAYQVASIAFVGGSLADRGGHNALEPAAASVPVIMGPNIYNNPVICAHLQERGALYVVSDAAAITAQCAKWLSDQGLASQAGQAGRAVLDSNRGALDKTLNALRKTLR